MVCVLDLFVASMPLSDSELKQMQADNPAAIDSAGKFKPLKALAANAKADFGRCQVCLCGRLHRSAILLGGVLWFHLSILTLAGCMIECGSACLS